MIPFNKPYITGDEFVNIRSVINSRKLSGNGPYTSMVHDWFEKNYGFKKVLLTHSCTDALEMCALLMDIKPDDEIIIPDYTFVSTANAFAIFGAKIVFADSREDHPGLDESKIESLITSKTKAIVAVHYAGVALEMEKIQQITKRHKLFLIEDAAQAIDSFYLKNNIKIPLGSFGDFSTFSFHETKNICSGEGGMLVVNNDNYKDLSNMIWEKGTNRREFFLGQANKYTWKTKGSSFLPSEITSAFLYAQLKHIKPIQNKRVGIWNEYFENLKEINSISDHDYLPFIPSYSTNNAHMFYIKMKGMLERNEFIQYMKNCGITTTFHYQSLNSTPFSLNMGWNRDEANFINSMRYSNCLVRLPMYYELSRAEIKKISNTIKRFIDA